MFPRPSLSCGQCLRDISRISKGPGKLQTSCATAQGSRAVPILHRREPELSSSTYLLLLLRLCSGLAKPSPHRLWFFFWAQRFCSTWLAQPSRAGPLFPCCPKPPRAGAVQAQPTFIHKSFQPHLLLSHLLFLEDFRLFLLFNSPQRVSLLCSILQVSLCAPAPPGAKPGSQPAFASPWVPPTPPAPGGPAAATAQWCKPF